MSHMQKALNEYDNAIQRLNPYGFCHVVSACGYAGFYENKDNTGNNRPVIVFNVYPDEGAERFMLDLENVLGRKRTQVKKETKQSHMRYWVSFDDYLDGGRGY